MEKQTASEFIKTLKMFRSTASTCANRLFHGGYTRDEAEAAMAVHFPRTGRKAVIDRYYEASLT